MARLPRLALAARLHWLSQRGHGGHAVFTDAQDRAEYLAALQVAAQSEQVRVHAFALIDSAAHLLVTPSRAEGIGRMMQALGRKFVSTYHRRHGGSGTLWDGRFRCALVEDGPCALDVLRLLDGMSREPGATSFSHRASDLHLPLLSDPPEFWALGNTPFDRQGAWRRLVDEGIPSETQLSLLTSAHGSWVIGSADFQRQVAELAARPASPRPRGRPAGRKQLTR